MKAISIVFLVVLSATAQSTPKVAARKAAPAPQPMSHDFRTAGRRVVNAIDNLSRSCTTVCSIQDLIDSEGKVSDAFGEANAQRDNATDKQALELLKDYNSVTFAAVQERMGARLGLHHAVACRAESCQAAYVVCKKEVEQAFEDGLVPVTLQCTEQAPAHDPK